MYVLLIDWMRISVVSTELLLS